MPTSLSPTNIRVTDIGEYIRHRSCDRRFHLRVNHKEAVSGLPFFNLLVNSLDPVLQSVGESREDQWEAELIAAGYADLGTGLPKGKRQEVEWADLATAVAGRTDRADAYCRQLKVTGTVGAFALTGFIDFALLRWRGGRPTVLLVECKASRRDRTYHRIQVATYQLLLRAIVAARPATVGGVILETGEIRGVVARIDEDSNTNQSILTLEPLDLASEVADIRQLLSASGRLATMVDRPLADIGFQIDSKCDGCIYNVHCMTESARLRQPELLGLDPVTCRLLKAAGLGTLDKIANPPLNDARIEALNRDPGFSENLDLLRLRATARRHTLPGGKDLTGEYEVSRIPNTGKGHLPPHEIDGVRVARVYLAVDYDYTENRIGALSAHVTREIGRLHTRLVPDGEKFAPDPVVYEQVETGKTPAGKAVYEVKPLPAGGELIEYKTAPWKGTNYADDTAAERELIQRFFKKLVGLIAKLAGTEAVPIHFYVWSAGEVRQLIEGCSRAGSTLLGHLRQLLGCREGLEQLLYSGVQDEVYRRFALGWTGRALPVVSSLRWFGRSYHWTRTVNGRRVDLDALFSQNVFDFLYYLEADAAGNWVATEGGKKQRYEVMSRFQDALPAAYWHAVWGTLQDPKTDDDPRLKRAIDRYRAANVPNMLEEFLTARVHALRWVEENITPKNDEIEKKPLVVKDLPDFRLERDDVAKTAIDFLRLDHHIKLSEWIAHHLQTPVMRVPLGRTLPLKNTHVEKDKKTVVGTIHLDGFDGLTLADLRPRCSFAAGSFVRLSPWNGDPKNGQTVKQLTKAIGQTCVVRDIDWKTGRVTLAGMYVKETRYVLGSAGGQADQPRFENGYATLDESVTDYVAGRVDQQLQSPSHVYEWLDPVRPKPPALSAVPTAELLDQCRAMLADFRLPPENKFPASDDQAAAVLAGLNARLQLLQGPPGTGKTATTALSVLFRVLVTNTPGDIVLVSAHTHTALDTLLGRIDRYRRAFAALAGARGLTMPDVALVKVHASDAEEKPVPGGVTNLTVDQVGGKKTFTDLSEGCVLLLGGTTGTLLRLHGKLATLKTYNDGRGLTGALLIVDEASMMVFPHFLALATLLAPDGRLMLTGDHRQLSPITAHDWETEDRPPTVLYQPFSSAYDAVRRIIAPDDAGKPRVPPTAGVLSALRLTFRLPPVVRELIAKLYRLDNIELEGLPRGPEVKSTTPGNPWNPVWACGHGLFLAVHTEDGSNRSNETELAIVRGLLESAPDLPAGSTAIITPHRAQRSLFQSKLTDFWGKHKPVDIIDTVERLQGGERPNVIVSATVSDPAAIDANAEFILDLNRANVAFSRVKDRLVVVCAETLLNHIPPEAEDYAAAMLWKSLRELCTEQVGELTVGPHRVRLLRPPESALRGAGAGPYNTPRQPPVTESRE